jgi:RNA polymerase sigma factor (sigma-70 family)
VSRAAINLLVRRLRGPDHGASAGCSDHDLLARFVAAGDETAFAALVRRHGPLVRGLCQRLLGDGGLADDAFQATFLVLARRAAAVRKRESVGSWLYGVARRVAHKARRADARRRRHERRAAEGRPRRETADHGWAELLAVLDEELAGLPERARAPLLLCYLEGYTQDEAARYLGWSVGTLRRRLTWGRDLLRLRLTRRGATLSAGLFAAALAPRAATAAVPAGLAGETARAAAAFAAGTAPATAAAALARGALSLGLPRPLTAVAVVLLALGTVTAAVLGRAYWAADEGPAGPRPPAAGAPEEKPGDGEARVDRRGDPLPEGALVRFGSTRFRSPGGIYSGDLSPDGKLIAMHGVDGALRLLDTATGRVRLTVRAHLPQGYNDGMRVLAFSPDGKSLLVCDTDPAVSRLGLGPRDTGAVLLLDVATGKETRRLAGAGGETRHLAFSPDGKQVAVSQGGGVTFYDAATGKEQRRVPPAGKWVAWWLAYAPDGRSVALPGATATTIRLCDPATGKEIRSFSNGPEVLNVAFAPDGKTLAAAGKDNVVRLWDVATGKQAGALPEGLGGVGRGRLSVLAFSPDGKVLTAAASDDSVVLWGPAGGSIALWGPAGGKVLGRLPCHTWLVTGLAFRRDGKVLFSWGFDGKVRRWDVAAGKEIRSPESDFDQSYLARSADGKLVATGGTDGTVTLWEAATGRRLRELAGHRGQVVALAFSPDGRRLATAGWEPTVRVWDVAGGRQERAITCAGASHQMEAVAFSPDGRRLAVADYGRGVVRLLDAATGEELRQLAQGGPAALAFAPDGKTLAAGGRGGGAVVLWDVATGGKVRTIPVRPGNGLAITDAVAFSPDGRLLATGHHHTAVCLWEAATGKLVREIETGGVTWCLAFSPDGAYLASGGTDGKATLWEVATGRRALQLSGHQYWVMRLAFGPDGRTLATGAYDGTSLLWSLRPGPEPLPPAGVGPLWEALRENDAARAYRAAWALAEHPERSVAFIKEHLRPSRPPVDRERLRRLLADLDSDEYPKREAASRELARLGAAVEPDLRAALEKARSAEARRRLQALVEGLPRELPPEGLRRLRAVRVLEWIGNRDAVELLRELSKAEDEALRREAGAALARLQRSGGR